jgi:hypothetical protein
MRTQSEDTSPEMERVQIELIRKASPAKLFGLVRSMSQTMMQASRENIRKLHPDASKEELTLILVELHYGKELANLVRTQMEPTFRSFILREGRFSHRMALTDAQ